MPVQAGTRLGPYEVIALIGAGGMGEVWLATELRLGRRVALKLLPSELTRDFSRILRFEHEACTASALNHPNVCTIYPLDQTNEGQHYIAMEYVEGETLRHRLVSSRLSLREALDIAIQVAAALSVAHAAGIVHRDIKPENVMLRPDGVVKVLDFGLAKLTSNDAGGAPSMQTAFHTDAGTVVGTVAYMSPEQGRGQEVDARTDIWSLGVVIYEMIAGRSPFAGSSGGDVLAAVLEHDPPAFPAANAPIPPELRRIVGKTLRKDREQRYQTMKDLLLDLQALGEEVELRPRSDSGTAASLPATNTPPRVTCPSRGACGNDARRCGCGVCIGCAPVHKAAHVSDLHAFNVPARSHRRCQVRAGWSDDCVRGCVERKALRDFYHPKGYPRIAVTESSFEFCSRDLVEGRNGHLARVSVGARTRVQRNARARPPLRWLAAPSAAHVRRGDWSSDGHSVAVIVREPSGVQRLEYPAGHAFASRGLSLARVARSGDRLAAYALASGSILLIDGSGASTTIASGYGLVHGLAWSPAGDEIWFSGLKAGGGASGWAILGVTPSGRQRVVYRADGQLVLQDVHRDGSMLVTRVEPRLITIAAQTDSGSESDPAGAVDLSRDGRSVLQGGLEFAAGGRHVLLLRKSDGSPPITLAEGYVDGTLSADGQYVIATSLDGQKLSIIPTGRQCHCAFERQYRGVWRRTLAS